MAEDLPQKFGNYTLHALVARGGMAEIYRATMPGIGGFEKTVAIKKILPHLAEDEEFITMLKDEANILVSITHSNIAQVYDLGKIDGTYFISMEYVHGIDLSGIVKHFSKMGEFAPIEHAVYIGSCMCAGLHAAHTNTDKQGNPLNIVHRDVSPHNVIISYAGDVKLIDFGVAKAAVKEGHTQMGVIKGKLLYMAPEQAQAKDIDGRADLFAVGLCIYKMLTHQLPFRGDNEFQIYNNILSKEIVPPRQLNPNVPQEVNQIVMTLLQRDADRRYQDGYQAKQAFERALHNIAPGYTVNRLSRFVETTFSEAAETPDPDDDERSGPADIAPETPASNAVGTDQLVTGEHVPELAPVSVSEGAEPANRPPNGAPPLPAGGTRTQTDQADTDQRQVDALAGAPSSSTGKSSTAIYAVGAMVALIVGLAGYGWMASPDEDPTPADGEQTSSGTPGTGPDLVRVALETSPPGAKLYRGQDFLGKTPHTLTLERSKTPTELSLQKPDYESQIVQIIPNGDRHKTIELTRSAESASVLNFPTRDAGQSDATGIPEADAASAQPPEAAPADPADDHPDDTTDDHQRRPAGSSDDGPRDPQPTDSPTPHDTPDGLELPAADGPSADSPTIEKLDDADVSKPDDPPDKSTTDGPSDDSADDAPDDDESDEIIDPFG